MSEETVRLGSDAWIAAAASILNDLKEEYALALASAGRGVSVCETFTDLPGDLAKEVDSSRSAWNFEIREGFARAARGERDDVDLRVVADYVSILPLAKTVYPSDPEQMAPIAALRADLERSGKLSAQGRRDELPPAISEMLSELHNRLAPITR